MLTCLGASSTAKLVLITTYQALFSKQRYRNIIQAATYIQQQLKTYKQAT
jgi:hypothetical protein